MLRLYSLGLQGVVLQIGGRIGQHHLKGRGVARLKRIDLGKVHLHADYLVRGAKVATISGNLTVKSCGFLTSPVT
jgi:hypothetical protein